MNWNLPRPSRAAWLVLPALLLVALIAMPGAAQAAAGGEANLKIPDLGQSHVAGMSGRTLLTLGLGVCVLGLAFGLVI